MYMENKTKVKKQIIKTIERNPVPLLGVDYKVKIVYKNINITELDIQDKVIKIALPNKFKKLNNTEILDLAIQKMYEQVAIVEIERAMEKNRIMLGFAPEEYEIKKMKKLGSCKNKVITINPEVVIYNRDVIDYIVLHEYCNLKHRSNSKAFFDMIKKYKPNYIKCQEILMKI